jgi:hypothetical protein
MIFLFPMMAYPGALALSGLIRLYRWQNPRTPSSQPR